MVSLNSILIVYGMAIIDQEPVCCTRVILGAVHMRITFTKLTKEFEGEFTVLIFPEFFYVISAYAYSGIVIAIIEVIIDDAGRGGGKICCDGLI